MADIGVQLFAEGEVKFKDALSNVNAQVKALNDELKLAVEEFAKADDKEKNLTKQTDLLRTSIEKSKDKVQILTDQYDKQNKKLEELKKEMEDAISAQGEQSKEAEKARNAYLKQETAVEKLKSQVAKAKTETAKLEKQLDSTERQLDDFGDAAEDAGDSLDDAKSGAKGFSEALSKQFIKEQVFDAVKSLASYLWNLVDATKEYRTIMGALEVSSTKAGYTLDEMGEAYKRLYGVLGDSQTTATTVANLQALNLEQSDLMTLIDGVTGAWTIYGDSIPIDGLAESINETAKVGQVTGTLADVLNWAEGEEDAFNEALAATGSVAEATQLIIQKLIDQGLIKATEDFRELNASIIETNEVQAEFEEAEARLAEAVAPAVNTIKGLMADGLNVFAAVAEETVVIIGRLITKTKDFAGEIYEIWLGIKGKIGGVVDAIIVFFNETIPNAVKDATQALKKLPGEIIDVGENIVSGLWQGIKNKAEWCKKKVTGFCGDVLGDIKDFFGIHSPSTVLRDDVGVMIDRGLAEGIIKGTDYVLNAANELNGKLLAKEEELTEKLKDTGLDDALKNSLTKELETVKNFRTEYQTALSEIEAAQSSMEEKLKNYGDLFTTVSTEAGDMIDLADLQQQIDAINEYGDALENLRNRGVSESLLTEIQGLDIDSATRYMDELMSLTDEDYDKYMKLWEEKQEASHIIASEFYEDKLKDLSDGMTSQMLEYYGEFEDVGQNLMDGVAEGIEDGRSGVVETVRKALEEAARAAREAMDINSPSKVFAKIGGYMADGLSVGFGSEMSAVENDIAGYMVKASDAATNSMLQNTAAAIVNNSGLNDSSSNGTPIIIQLVTDGQTLAQVVFDPLKSVAKQRGVAFG